MMHSARQYYLRSSFCICSLRAWRAPRSPRVVFSIAGATVASSSRRGFLAAGRCWRVSALLASSAMRLCERMMRLLSLLNSIALKLSLLVEFSLRAVFFHEVLGSSEAFNAIFKSDDCAFVHHFSDHALMNRADSEDCLKYVPGILLEPACGRERRRLSLSISRT